MNYFAKYIAVVMLCVFTCLEDSILSDINLFSVLTFYECKYIINLGKTLLVEIAIVYVEEEYDTSDISPLSR